MNSVMDSLREARRQRGLTQREVAEVMGTTQSAVARMEGGGVSPRLGTVSAYAAVVGSELTAGPPDLLGECVEHVRRALALDDPDTALRALVQFIDDALRVTSVDAVLLREPPSSGDRRWDAAVAAAAAWVARRRACDAPGWTAAPSRFLDGPWFPVADVLGRPLSAALAAHLLAAAPVEFFGRGVIIDAATLESV